MPKKKKFSAPAPVVAEIVLDLHDEARFDTGLLD
jgi:hypothetical protein